ncbi:type I-C CRISPR-associated protein Cas8c/Csd1 [Sporolactobacillus sp. CQH2019]|uniref:type I-C CRISPR-associated protein Cas8c/Csd1 n=1 Tax=Sporolactobacillus sp. CQH2019 TaxID=3023512 RepID=UPI0023678A9E|nr:type I-C CRISPR-associated protein Cas8c/Csd1 [Sporolactobacillus sp. CQH2019]MDD9147995.1 type I-C CRISPR-associated protein Cas8c/Csd1 [Sporolactobacillus sp. CQH2019]
MILQSLVKQYDILAARGRICPIGWSTAKVSYALQLAANGSVFAIISLKISSKDGKKEIPQSLQVPEQVKKTSGIAANFLCDNGTYMLGADDKSNPERTKKCFEAAKALHHEILDEVESAAAKAVLAFFDTWNIDMAMEDKVLLPYLDDIKAGANLIFQVGGSSAQEDDSVKSAWEKHHLVPADNAVIMCCLVTGKKAPVARLHPNIKGINGAQPSGASLISYNAPAFESYGHESSQGTGQGLNAPVSESAAFKYGAVLNYMTADREHVQHIADTTILYWAEDAEPLCQDVWSAEAFGTDKIIGEEDLRGIVNALSRGGNICFKGTELRADNCFYVLGLAPNASRLSVRFFLQGEFGTMLRNLNKHNKRLEIVRPVFETRTTLPLWQLLNETANQKAKNRMPPAPMAGAVLRSILRGTDYPVSLFENIMLRIRTEHNIKWQKAAILKAYFLKNRGIRVPEEVLQVELNEKSDYLPYILGRLFAVLEKVQGDANPGIKATIRNKYFSSASATPGTIFPLLLGLSQHHQRKLPDGSKIYYDKMISELENCIQETLPIRLSLQEQGAFYLGYYHEKQALYTSKNEENK